MILRSTALLTLVLLISSTVALAQDGMAPGQPPQAPQAETPPATAPTTRSLLDIQAEAMQVQTELMRLLGDPAALTDPQKRDTAAPQVVPQFKRLLTLVDEAAALASNPAEAQQFKAGRYYVLSLMMAFGDEQAAAELGNDTTPEGRSALAVGKFIGASTDEQRMQAVNVLETLAQEHPEHPAVGQGAISIYQLASERSPQAAEAVASIVMAKLKGTGAIQYQQALLQIRQQEAMIKEFQDRHIGKPLTIEGTTLAGEPFNIANWKGKVVLVDFWASAIPTSAGAMPALIEDFKKYHDQGFEVVGVGLDRSAEPLKLFLAANTGMTWPQVYTEADPMASIQVAQKIGIPAVPTTFLLDRKGNVRAVAVGGGFQLEKLRAMIPELLKEAAE